MNIPLIVMLVLSIMLLLLSIILTIIFFAETKNGCLIEKMLLLVTVIFSFTLSVLVISML